MTRLILVLSFVFTISWYLTSQASVFVDNGKVRSGQETHGTSTQTTLSITPSTWVHHIGFAPTHGFGDELNLGNIRQIRLKVRNERANVLAQVRFIDRDGNEKAIVKFATGTIYVDAPGVITDVRIRFESISGYSSHVDVWSR